MNKTHLVIWFLTSCIVFACGQKTKETQDISSIKTNQHVNIPGTRLYIIPPKDFKIANSFFGLQKNENTIIQIIDLNGGNFYTNAATFCKEEFEKKGIKVYEFKELKINNYPAKYICIQREQNLTMKSVVFGDSTFSTTLNAIYAAKDGSTENEIDNAISSIYYDKNEKIDPLSTAPFTIDDSKSVFKFEKLTGPVYFYSIGGTNKESYETESFIMISIYPKTPSNKSMSEQFITGIEKHGFTDKEYKKISTEEINGQSAYEVEIHGKIKDLKCLIYQLVVSNNDKTAVIQGVIRSDFEKYLQEAKSLARVIKLK